MNKYLLSLLFKCLIGGKGLAQLTGKLTIGQGYDYNLFNAPSYFIDSLGNEIGTQSLINNGPYGFLKTDLGYGIKKNVSLFKWDIKGAYQHFPSNHRLNKQSIEGLGTYRRRINKKHLRHLPNQTQQ